MASIFDDHDYESMFQPGTGVRWCEDSYQVSNYIAEFYNTVSNLALVVLPVVSLKLMDRYFAYNRWAMAAIIIMGICGLCSMYYHATLSLCGQILDELSIFWGVMAGYNAWFPISNVVPNFIKDNVTVVRINGVLFTVLCSIISFSRPHMNHLFMFLFLAPPTGFIVVKEALNVYNDGNGGPEREVGLRAGHSLVLGMACWILDKLSCPLWILLGIPLWHALWHVFAALACHHTMVFYAYLDAKQNLENAETKVTIEWVPNIPNCPTIPYVLVQDKHP